MNLTTKYLGFDLPHPFIVGASPMVEDLDTVRRLEDAGCSAIVMNSLFEEQIKQEQMVTFLDTEVPSESFAEALSYFPEPEQFRLGPDRYLEHLQAIKAEVDVPVIASLNGITDSGWLEYARLLEEAGADALELNVYYVATDPQETGEDVEQRTVSIVREVKQAVEIPLAVKLSPYWSSFAHVAHDIERAGANALVLFNRFYQPDIDVEDLEAVPALRLSDSSELLLRLRWLAILYGHCDVPMAVTGGVHQATDAVKALMAGASAVQMVSALLLNGPEHLGVVLEDLGDWLEEHEYDSLEQMVGSMSHRNSPDPAAFERGNYARLLQTWGREI